ncbi:MAG: response regulator [Chloroflexi bacterium]|nr:response regulator [Chloroflexota bacterium]
MNKDRATSDASGIAELRRAEQALSESEARFRALADTVPVLIWMSGPDTLCTYFNKVWLEFTGRTMEQELGNGWAEGIHPDDFQTCIDTYVGAFDGREAFTIEYRLRRHDSDYRWVLDTGVPRFTPEGTFSGFIGSCIDITDRRRLEEQFLHSQKMEAVGRLAGGIAHDFNNLLTVINGYSQILLDELPDGYPGRDEAEEIRKVSDRATALTQQLLAFSRRQVVQPRVLDLNEALASLSPLLRRLIGEDIDLSIALEAASCPVLIDPGQLEQVVLNLAVNARDAMPDGGSLTFHTALAEITAETQGPSASLEHGPYVVLSVNDTGSGMDDATLAHIFEPFFSTRELGRGTGLGLSTVYAIIDRFSGHIEATSTPAEGSTFTIHLPRAGSSAEPAEVAVADSSPRGTATVLLAEDAPAVRDLVRLVLERQGYRVLAAQDGAQALRMAHSHDGVLDMVITDLVMPGLGGQELVERLRTSFPDVRVLFMSGYGDDMAGGPSGPPADAEWLAKPFAPDALVRKVQQMLDAARAEGPVTTSASE